MLDLFDQEESQTALLLSGMPADWALEASPGQPAILVSDLAGAHDFGDNSAVPVEWKRPSASWRLPRILELSESGHPGRFDCPFRNVRSVDPATYEATGILAIDPALERFRLMG
jgi:hypothetical protein